MTSALGLLGMAALLGSLVAVPAHANGVGLVTCTTTMGGANEVPPNGSPATGTVSYTFDPATSASTWSVTFSGLTAPATAAHVHAPAPPGSNAAVVVPLTTIPAATSGSYSGSATTSFPTVSEPTAAQYASDLLSGNAYANIHTSNFPGGEIRGQLTCSQAVNTPEFSPGLGFLAVLAVLLPVALALRGLRRPTPASF